MYLRMTLRFLFCFVFCYFGFLFLILLPLQCWNCRHEPPYPFYMVLGIKSRTLSLLDKHSTNEAMTPAFSTGLNHTAACVMGEAVEAFAK